MAQLKTIQVLRAIAALAVLFAHLHGIEARHSGETPLISKDWLSGVGGVDLFFVISGFIMVWVAWDAPQSARSAGKFLFARVTRIYPLWWLFAGATCLYLYLSYGVPWDAENLGRLGVSGQESLIKSFLLIPHDAYPVLSVGWTLMHEMYFYLVFAALLLLPQRFRIPALILWGLLVLATTSAQTTGFYANTFLTLALFPMTLEFLMGAAIGLMIKAGTRRHSVLSCIAGLCWLIWAIVAVDFKSIDYLLPSQRTFAFGPAFALLIYGLVTLELKGKLEGRLPAKLVMVGDWSYALYLSHILVLSAVARLFFPVFGREGYLDNAVFLILAVISSIIASGLVYRFFENPLVDLFRKLRQRIFQPPPPPIVSGSASLSSN